MLDEKEDSIALPIPIQKMKQRDLELKYSLWKKLEER